MIDILPTILELCGLPIPEIVQGRSLAPLLLGKEGWEPRPVIIDEFYVDRRTGGLSGLIEVVDGRWGASLEIGNGNLARNELFVGSVLDTGRRRAPLLLYDLWNDPHCVHSLHEEQPELVTKYSDFLRERWEKHRLLAGEFTRSEQAQLTAEQLRTLRALGYIQ
jgi:arylsulfatase A-like enzyme